MIYRRKNIYNPKGTGGVSEISRHLNCLKVSFQVIAVHMIVWIPSTSGQLPAKEAHVKKYKKAGIVSPFPTFRASSEETILSESR